MAKQRECRFFEIKRRWDLNELACAKHRNVRSIESAQKAISNIEFTSENDCISNLVDSSCSYCTDNAVQGFSSHKNLVFVKAFNDPFVGKLVHYAKEAGYFDSEISKFNNSSGKHQIATGRFFKRFTLIILKQIY